MENKKELKRCKSCGTLDLSNLSKEEKINLLYQEIDKISNNLNLNKP